MIHDKDDSAASDDVGDECGGGLGQGEDPVHHGGSQHHPGDALLSESGSNEKLCQNNQTCIIKDLDGTVGYSKYCKVRILLIKL